MMSMTGFGKAEISTKLGTFAVEVSSVNNRFLEVQIRQPRPFTPLENNLRELVAKYVNRGKIQVFVAFEESSVSASKYAINMEALAAYHRQLTKLKRDLKLAGEVELRELLVLPEVAEPRPLTLDQELIWAGLQKAADKALRDMVRMRLREGAALAKEFAARLEVLTRLTRQLIEDSSGAVRKYREKLTVRLDELLGGRVVDQVRIEEEIALMAERTDITEECTRLLSHIDQCRKKLREKGAVGKTLNFILQELNREANTVASKSTEIEISRASIAIKDEVEKMREQIQNIE